MAPPEMFSIATVLVLHAWIAGVSSTCPVSPQSNCKCYDESWALTLGDGFAHATKQQCMGSLGQSEAFGSRDSLSTCITVCAASAAGCKSVNYNFKSKNCIGWPSQVCAIDTITYDTFEYYYTPSVGINTNIETYVAHTVAENTCYWVSSASDVRSYSDAQVQCQNLGGQLAELNTEDKVIFLKHNAPTNIGAAGNMWIGLSNDPSVHSALAWNDASSPGYLNWGVNEPGLASYCVNIDQDLLWYAAPCSSQMRYVCELTDSQCRMGSLTSNDVSSVNKAAQSLNKYDCLNKCFLDSNCQVAQYSLIYMTCHWAYFGAPFTLGVGMADEVQLKTCPIVSTDAPTSNSTSASTDASTTVSTVVSTVSSTSSSTNAPPITSTDTPTAAPTIASTVASTVVSTVSSSHSSTDASTISSTVVSRINCVHMFNQGRDAYFNVQNGFKLIGHVLLSMSSQSKMNCCVFCLQNALCMSVNYDSSNKVCELLDSRADVSDLTASGSDWSFAAYVCS
ncbi:unnamed protein product [Owenia fusiformis]|uniref:C-type lectin n=1 Tax=Owenia fusiformis TaxID=6347 RepID=A0A8S4N2F6_OWEFU|nr:unnamed protein product [Owenia fusiformis]